jgi:hypothetical protein
MISISRYIVMLCLYGLCWWKTSPSAMEVIHMVDLMVTRPMPVLYCMV